MCCRGKQITAKGEGEGQRDEIDMSAYKLNGLVIMTVDRRV